jgi:hypothetical protein
MDVGAYPRDSYAGSNGIQKLVPLLSSDLYRPSRLLMALCSELHANPSELKSTLILSLSSFKLLSLSIFNHSNIFYRIVINNNHKFLLLPDLLCNALPSEL